MSRAELQAGERIIERRILPGSTEHVDKQQQEEIAEISLIEFKLECKTELGVHHHMQITAVVILLPTLSYIALPGWRRCHMAGSGQESGSRREMNDILPDQPENNYCTSATPSINNPSLPTTLWQYSSGFMGLGSRSGPGTAIVIRSGVQYVHVVAMFIWLYGAFVKISA